MKKVFTNFIYQASYQMLLIFLPIITIPIVSNSLGTEGIGKFSFVSSIVSYFVLIAGLGLANYGVREIAIVRNDRSKLTEKFWELQFFNLFFSLASLIVFIIFALTREEKTLYMIQSMVVLGAVFDISWFFSGLEDFKKITIRNFVIKIATFILIVIFIKNKNDLFKYFLIQSSGTLLGSISLWININEYIDFKWIKLRKIYYHFWPALSYFIAKIAITLYQNLNKTILGIVVSMSAVGLYANAMSLITMTGSIINAMNTVMIPRMSNIVSKGNKEEIIPILEKTIHLQLYITVAMSFGIAGISGTLVPWFFGSNFLELIKILPFISPVLVLQSLQMSIATQYLIPMGKIREYNISVVIGAIVSVCLTFILAHSVGVYSAIVGISLGYLVICLLRGYSLVKNSSFKFWWGDIIKCISMGLIMAIIIYLIGYKLPSNLFVTVLQVIVGGCIYMGLTTLIKINPFLDLWKNRKNK